VGSIAVLISLLVVACSGPSPSTRHQTGSLAAPTFTPVPTPTPDLRFELDESKLPATGEPVDVPGEGLTITVLKVVDWPAPTFLADPALAQNNWCDSKVGDKFVAVEIRMEATAKGADFPTAALGLYFVVGPPHGSPLAAVLDVDGYRTPIVNVCSLEAYDPAQVPPCDVGTAASLSSSAIAHRVAPAVRICPTWATTVSAVIDPPSRRAQVLLDARSTAAAQCRHTASRANGPGATREGFPWGTGACSRRELSSPSLSSA
jgi:hypothetical protein